MRHCKTPKTMVPLKNNNNNNNSSRKNDTSLPRTMESLQLPAELYWEGKTEEMIPLSSSELFSVVDYSIAENWMDEDNIAIEIINSEDDLKFKLNLEEPCELLDGDDLVMELCNFKEEHWNNTKFHTPNITTAYVDDGNIQTSCIIQQPNSITKVEFQNSLDSVVGMSDITAGNIIDLLAPASSSTVFDNAILTQLTPPHSPPLQSNTIINSNQHFISPGSNFNTVIQQQPVLIQSQSLPLLPQQEQQEQNGTFSWQQTNSIATPAPSFDDLQTRIVDEIVNTRAQELQDWHDKFESLSTSSSSSLAGSFMHADESVTDEDWLPSSENFLGSSASSASASPYYADNNEQQQQSPNHEVPSSSISNSSCNQSSSKSPLKKRTRPYGRAVEDRKVRKKEQNKNAATRYRQKKKLEMEVVLSEEQTLLERNDELKEKLAERKREAKYLKTLIREFYNKQQLKDKK